MSLDHLDLGTEVFMFRIILGEGIFRKCWKLKKYGLPLIYVGNLNQNQSIVSLFCILNI
jgi:hypothetical protein